MLLFKEKFIEQIRSGEKTQTVRLWKYRRMRSGQRSYIPGIGYILITSVERVEFEKLTDADAVPDGFPSADALRAELCTLYGADALARRKLYIIRFSVYPPSEQQAITEEQHKKRLDETTKNRLFGHFECETL
jgi:hypothetical protein